MSEPTFKDIQEMAAQMADAGLGPLRWPMSAEAMFREGIARLSPSEMAWTFNELRQDRAIEVMAEAARTSAGADVSGGFLLVTDIERVLDDMVAAVRKEMGR